MFTSIAIPIRHALLSMSAVAALTNLSAREIVELAENGAFKFCFDLSSARSRVPCWRIMTGSLVEYLRDGKKLRRELPGQARTEIDSILPEPSQLIMAEHTVARLFGCSPLHVRNLIRAGHLQSARQGRPGRTGQGAVWRASVLEFLLSRRVV